jgi:hypothetical protein
MFRLRLERGSAGWTSADFEFGLSCVIEVDSCEDGAERRAFAHQHLRWPLVPVEAQRELRLQEDAFHLRFRKALKYSFPVAEPSVPR